MAFEKEGDEYRYTRWNSHTEVTGVGIAMPPDFLMTEAPDFPSRLRVDAGSTAISERGILAATYYLQIENIAGSGAARGVYNFILEERG